MTDETKQKLQPMPEQLAYANLLQIGALSGIVIMLVTYLIYICGILPPHVEMSLVTAHWGNGVNEYIHATNSPHGWDWLSLLGTGDFVNFIGLALLALLTIPCYLILLPGFFKRKDYVYAAICITEVIVLAVAASGVLGSGGH